LLDEVLKAFETVSDGLIVDCTLGLGGHSEALLKTKEAISLVGLDRDLVAIKCAEDRLRSFDKRFRAIHSDFRDLLNVIAENNLEKYPVRAILLDLGVSSMQLDTASRGFSFQHDGPLDMRMDFSQGETAADIVNSFSEEELANLIYEYGEEPASRIIAKQIVYCRETKLIETTTELANLITRAINFRDRKMGRRADPKAIHPATRTFQALRIAVNRELTNLDKFIQDAVNLLAPNGRLAIISFHSLEDRIVKNSYRFLSGTCQCPPRLPKCLCGTQEKVKVLTKKPLIADETETKSNPRSRSAKLRVCEKINN
jgi:16S rRNA (cytosine1402-N4)-methyltransferase